MRAVTGIDLDKRRVLLYRVSDAVAIEQALNGESFEEALQRRGYVRLVAFLWGGLRHADDRLTRERLMKILDNKDVNLDYAEAWNIVSEALMDSGLIKRRAAADAEAAPDEDPTSAQSSGPTPP